MTAVLKRKKPVAKKKTAPVKKPLTAKQKLQREIEKRNKLFQAASPAEKRVLIAKDVIAQIKAKRYMPQTGSWVRPINSDRNFLNLGSQFDAAVSVRELFLSKKIESCACCALGAMFMSCTLYNNKTTVQDFDLETDWFDVALENKQDPLSNELNVFFSIPQLKLIECAFEGNNGAFEPPQARRSATAKWYSSLPDSEKRLVAIMNNIIENNGTFVP